jgi:predicted N-acetyltransferase YhbS
MSDRNPIRVAVPVREATPADHPAVRHVLRAAYQQYETVLPPGAFGIYLEDLLDLDDRARTGRLLVAERDGRIVGAVTFYEDAADEGFGWPHGWAGLRALGVHPAARGRGVGHQLMDACLQGARRIGAEVLCLHSAGFMTDAVAIYEAMGFRRAPEFDFEGTAHFQVDGDERVQVIAYRLDLSEPHRSSEEHIP